MPPQAQFGPDHVNDSFGFVGTLTGWPNISKMDAIRLFNQVVAMLGDDPEKARQYLNATEGRHFVDSLSFLTDRDTSTADMVAQAIKR